MICWKKPISAKIGFLGCKTTPQMGKIVHIFDSEQFFCDLFPNLHKYLDFQNFEQICVKLARFFERWEILVVRQNVYAS